MQVFHIATAADWAAAAASRSYTTSTLGRTLEQEGFLHAARREQVATVFASFYRGVREPLLLLTIETDKLASPWREDGVGDDTYPHIYGPLNTSAVVRAQPLNRRGGIESFTSLFAKEMLVRVFLALGVMLLMVVGVAFGQHLPTQWGSLLGALAGLVIGGAGFGYVLGRRG
jgi:uncharacterized protein (DUF952 family)